MTESSDDRHRIGKLRWYHWLIVVLAGLNGASGSVGAAAMLAGGLGGAVGGFIFVVVLRAIWHIIGPYYRTTDGGESDQPVESSTPSR